MPPFWVLTITCLLVVCQVIRLLIIYTILYAPVKCFLWNFSQVEKTQHSRRHLRGARPQPTRDWRSPWRLGWSRSRLYFRDGPGDRPIHREENLLAVMAHLQR